MRAAPLKWQSSTTPPPRDTSVLPEFLEEQLWALRDRVDALDAVPLSESLALTLALVGDELTDAGLMLRRPTRSNRESVTALIGQMRTMLDTIERDVCPARTTA
jgi:hypothetical protein